MPLASVVYDFYDKIKSASSGFASFDYEIKEFRKSLFSNAEEEDIHTNQQVNDQTEEKKNTKPPRSKKKKV